MEFFLKKTRFFFFGVVILTVFLLPAAGFCDGWMVADELVKMGKLHYEEGDYAGAIHALSKAVMVDPNNREAQYYLKKLGFEGGYYARNESKLDKVAELSRQIVESQKEIDKLQQKNMEEKAANQALQEEKKGLIDQLNFGQREKNFLEVKVDHVREEGRVKDGHIETLAKQNTAKEQEIKKLSTDILEYKGEVVEKIAVIRQKDNMVGALSDQVDTLKEKDQEKERAWQEKSIDYENKIVNLQDALATQKHATFKNESQYKEQVTQLNELLRRKRAELGQANDKILFTEHQIQQKDLQLANKDQQITDLRTALASIETKFSSMETRVSSVESSKKAPADPMTVKFLKRQDKIIAQLKERLIMARKEMNSLESDLAGEREKMKTAVSQPPIGSDQDNERIARLREQLDYLREQLQDKNLELEDSRGKYASLEESLQDNQQRLDLVERVLEEKDNQIKQLEKQLMGVLSQFEQ